jgi:plasmid rolling circle replication initiator protein Rep
MKKRVERLAGCNKVWDTETYAASNVKVLLRTFLCKDKFCPNCQAVKQTVLWNRLQPYIEQHKDSLYHMTLTVPDCTGEELYDTVRHMARCFKNLVTYLNGNKKVRGKALFPFDYKGCFRSLEIKCKGKNLYHPHFHVAAVFGNGGALEDKHIINEFSRSKGHKDRLFSDYEVTIQRLWWLLINGRRCSYPNIYENDRLGRYSCVVDKYRPDECERLIAYVIKGSPIEDINDEDFRTLYQALRNCRQIQGYGDLYHVKSAEETGDYSERDYQILEQYIISGDRPVSQYERTECLMDDDQYTILRAKHRPEKFKH